MKASDIYLNTKGCCVSVCGLCVSQSPNPLPGEVDRKNVSADLRLLDFFLVWNRSTLALKYHVAGCYANQRVESRVLEYRLKTAA